MEYIFAYVESPTLDKSLSYLSGVGGDLSFDIGYFLRESKCSTRYYDFNLFLDTKESFEFYPELECLEKLSDTIGCESHLMRVDKYKLRGTSLLNLLDYVSRDRNSGIQMKDYSILFDTNRAFREMNQPLYFENNTIQKIYFSQLKYFERKPYSVDEVKLISSQRIYTDKLSKYNTDFHASDMGPLPFNEQEILSLQQPSKGSSIERKDIFGKRYTIGVEAYDAISIGTKTIKILVDSNLEVASDDPDIDIDNSFIFSNTEDKTADYNDGIFFEGSDCIISIVDGELVSIPQKNIYSGDTNTTVQGDNVYIHFNKDETVGVPRKSVHSSDSFVVDKYINSLGGTNSDILVSQFRKGVFQNLNFEYVGDYPKELNTDNGVIDVDMDTKEVVANISADGYVSSSGKTIYEDLSSDMVGKENHGIYSPYTFSFMNKESKEQNILESGFVNKLTSRGIFEIAEIALAQSSIGAYMQEYNHYVGKGGCGIGQGNLDNLFVGHGAAGIITPESVFAYRSNSKGIYNQSTIIGYKRYRGLYIEDATFGIERDNERGIIYNTLFEYISKSNHGIDTHNTYCTAIKNFNKLDLPNHNMFYSKYPKNTFVNREYTLFGRTPYKVELISKEFGGVSKGYRMIREEHTSFFTNKNYRSTDIAYYAEFLTKDTKKYDITDTYLWYSMPMRSYRIDSDIVGVIKTYYNADFEDELTGASPVPRKTHKYKEEVNFDLYKYLDIEKNAFAQRENNNKTLIHTQTQGNVSRTKVKDLNVERYGRFAYTDKPDYALIEDDRVDELILPHSDFNYENLAKKLVVDGQIDYQYIKRIDDDGNIFVNLPVKNPIRIFADLAVDYVDLNVGMLIYIIEKIYNIWQNNIFQYSAMSSDMALNDILKKAHHNLFIQYPDEKDQTQLHRAIRLFRWYAEMSILNNAEYVVKLKYKDLAVDYGNKDISTFDTIAVFDNLEIDDTFVLTPIDKTLPSHFVLNIDRSHKVRPSFTLAVTGGECIVTMNGESTTYTEQMVDFSELLDSGQNSIDVQFIPNSPEAYFGVMKLKIENYTIESYTVSYVGKIGETNPTINQLITMLSVCGDSIEAVQRTVGNATPVANALDQMRVYFNLHHEEKLKGKRLTIRK